MSGSNKNKAKEKPTHPNSNPKKSGKTVPAMNTVRAVSPELSPPSSPDTATASATASANRPSTSQPTLASVMAAIGHARLRTPPSPDFPGRPHITHLRPGGLCSRPRVPHHRSGETMHGATGNQQVN